MAVQLAKLIARQQEISGQNLQVNNFKKKDILPNNPEAKGAKEWFVLPDVAELEKYNSIKIVSGSPIIDVLRDRYENQYKTRIDDTQKSKVQNMTPEAQFEFHKELDRQKAFVENYKEPSSIEDQDIFVHQVASQFITDQYKTIEPQTTSQDRTTKQYVFPDGKLIAQYDNQSKRHYLEIEGRISGAFSLCIKRRTDSGRIIDDAYDIVEFRDGGPSFYTSSSKGNISLRNANDIRRSASQSRISLEKPTPVEIKQSSSDKTQEQVAQQPILDQTKTVENVVLISPNIQQEPFKAAVEEIEQKQTETVQSADQQPGSGGYFFRNQLSEALKKETSATTINYLVSQLAKQENKSINDIKQEFKIQIKEQKDQAATQTERSSATVTPQKNTNPSKSDELEKIKKALIESLSTTNTKEPASTETTVSKKGKAATR
jgi:hypothetical protein